MICCPEWQLEKIFSSSRAWQNKLPSAGWKGTRWVISMNFWADGTSGGPPRIWLCVCVCVCAPSSMEFCYETQLGSFSLPHVSWHSSCLCLFFSSLGEATWPSTHGDHPKDCAWHLWPHLFHGWKPGVSHQGKCCWLKRKTGPQIMFSFSFLHVYIKDFLSILNEMLW